MSNLLREVNRVLNDDVVVQLTRQLGAQDANVVKKATHGAAEVLLDVISRNANNPQTNQGLFGALEKDHNGGILGNILGVLTGKSSTPNPRSVNGTGIINHLLGNRQLEAAQMISQFSGLDLFKSGVLMQLIAPIIMNVVGQQRQSNNLDLGGLAKVLMGGGQERQAPQNQSGGGLAGAFGKLLDMDGDGSVMDDLLNIGVNILKK